MRVRRFLFWALALFETTPLRAQAPAPPADAVFHADAQVVVVDAAVTDKKGNVPRDLTAQDFKIVEDGKEQKISSISFTGSAGPGRNGRHFLALVFEMDQPAFRQEAMRFVDKFAGPDLYLAIYVRVNREIHLALPFTTDPARIKAALTNMQIVGAGLDYTDKNLVPHSVVMENVSSVAAELSRVHGRKALVLFTYEWYAIDNRLMTLRDGTTVRANPNNLNNDPIERSILQGIDDCNQANVSVYSFTLSTMLTGSPEDWYHPEHDLQNYQRANYTRSTNRIRDLAVGTGGRYGNPGSNQLAEFIGSIADQQESYYVLSYTPSATAAASNCHKLKVTVIRKGLDVDARESYCASGLPDSALKPAQRALEARTETGAVAISLQATWFYARRGTAVVDVATNVDPSAMQIKGKLHGEIPVLGVAYRADGSVAARFGDTVDLKFDTQAQLNEFLKTPYHYTKQISLPPGSYRLRVSAGAADKAFGHVERQLAIVPWGGETLSASAIALGDHDNPINDATLDLDASLLEGPYRLVSKGREFIPMAGNRFHPGQEGLLYLEIYEPRLAVSANKQAARPPSMNISVVDRASGEPKIDSGALDTQEWARPASGLIRISMRLPSADLPVGSYQVEVRVTHDEGKDEVVRTADFEVR